MANIALIPCRGGSKGIPRKNLRAVHGIPLVIRTVFACLDAGLNHIYVSTDDEEIGTYVKAAGAKVLQRPADLAQDESSTDSVLSHEIQSLLKMGYTEDDNLLLIQATTPFTKGETIRHAFSFLENSPNVGVFTAINWHGFVWDLKDGVASPYLHDHKKRSRRQDLSPQVLETGGFYGGSIARLRDSRVRFVEPLVPILVDKIESIEIDTLDDLKFCNSISIGKSSREVSRVKVLFTDFDGVLTDNRVLQLENNEAGSVINRIDGVAINQLKSKEIPVVIITGESSGGAFGRAKKLGIPCIYSEDKLKSIIEYCSKHSVMLSEVAYVGNDLNDLESLATCGWTFAPEDANPSVLKYARFALRTKGGSGVIRELLDFL